MQNLNEKQSSISMEWPNSGNEISSYHPQILEETTYKTIFPRYL